MLGITIAIACAFTWSLSIILLKLASNTVNPIILNLGKNVLGLCLLVPTAYIMDGPLPNISTEHHIILFLSGFFGIGIADALVLKAMETLSASRIAVLECLFAPFVITLSVLFLGESINIQQGLGGLAIALSLVLVLPKAGAEEAGSPRGTLFMISGLLTMAAGILAIKPLFDSIPLFWIIAIRMVAGVLGSLFPLYFVERKKDAFWDLFRVERRWALFFAFFLSAYVSITLWIAGYKYLQATVASVLNQTSTLFTVIMAVLIIKEEFTPKKAIATVLATIGVIIMSAH